MKKAQLIVRKAVVFNPADMVRYQKGAIVSGTMLEGKAGSITSFAFDKGQKLSEHTAPFDAMVEVLDGIAEITISGKSNILKRGDMIVMPADKPHAVTAVERFKMLLIMIKKYTELKTTSKYAGNCLNNSINKK